MVLAMFERAKHGKTVYIKEYGLKKMVEGEIANGQKLLLVDDLISSGFSKLFAINALREEGANLEDLFVFIDRTLNGLGDFEKEHLITE
ncbi:hypothetical protein LCGC14_0519600 [marine sediment metagenome]|uniref:Phosphoribosyltransferase domain-containing protein n=1 Tax=marine sediment metagenome TaxID=412755 RepID=A0A0F9RZ12_9ZZZZ|nr:MAG: Orotate phosphoribosyltransferase [Candidatus Lokiarchaeum sp. GC14_75]HEC36801.1 hypothetical protein [bacterium]